MRAHVRKHTVPVRCCRSQVTVWVDSVCQAPAVSQITARVGRYLSSCHTASVSRHVQSGTHINLFKGIGFVSVRLQ